MMVANDNDFALFSTEVRTVALNAAVTGFLNALLKPVKPVADDTTSWYLHLASAQSGQAMAA
jgi:hypothetical protein